MLVTPAFVNTQGGEGYILGLIAALSKRRPGITQLDHGIYELGHWNFDSYLPYHHRADSFVLKYPILSDSTSDVEDRDYLGCSGVCDSYKQVLDKCPFIEASQNRFFVISLVKIVRADQDPEGGWRWHKWGTYIGTHEIQHEYLYDEQDIEFVYTFRVWELVEGMIDSKRPSYI